MSYSKIDPCRGQGPKLEPNQRANLFQLSPVRILLGFTDNEDSRWWKESEDHLKAASHFDKHKSVQLR